MSVKKKTDLSRDWNQIADRLKEKINQEPQEILAYYELALGCYLGQRYHDTEKHMKSLLAKQPDLSLAHFLLGLAARAQKKNRVAQHEFSKALGLIRESLGLAEAPAPKKTEAVWNPELQAFKERYPEDPNLAEVKYYEKVVASGEYSYEQTYLLGLAYKRLGWYSAAVVAFQKVIKMRPDYDEPYFELGNTYKHLGKFAEAVRAYQAALQRNPEADEAYFHLGLAHLKLGQLEAARQARQKLEALNPGLGEQLGDEIEQVQAS